MENVPGFLANLTCCVLFASHDRTMQDIVYKLVPGLQEGECQNVALEPAARLWGAFFAGVLAQEGALLCPPGQHLSCPCAELTSTEVLAASTMSASLLLRSEGTCRASAQPCWGGVPDHTCAYAHMHDQ